MLICADFSSPAGRCRYVERRCASVPTNKNMLMTRERRVRASLTFNGLIRAAAGKDANFAFIC